jgi:hypothetical protein
LRNKKSIKVILLFIILIVTLPFCLAGDGIDDDEEIIFFDEEDDTQSNEESPVEEGEEGIGLSADGDSEEEIIVLEDLSEDIEEIIPGVILEPQEEGEPIVHLEQVTDQFQIEDIKPDTTITTSQGTLSDFSFSNALFSFGALTQGVITSATSNNPLFFESIFDDSQFEATLDEDDSLEIAQQNAFGQTGQVYVSLDGGNLTQDGTLTFIPDGDNPTYIYYNSTEIEFEDGTVEYLGESITNNDDTKGSTTLTFDENGFIRVELHPNNIYTSFDFAIKNTDATTKIVCKGDPLCDINIDQAVFTIKGKNNFSYINETTAISTDPNNEITINTLTGEITLENRRPNEEELLTTFSGNHKITETQLGVFDLPVAEQKNTLIRTYTSNLNELIFSINGEDTLLLTGFSSFIDSQKIQRAPKVSSFKVSWLWKYP